VVDLVAERPDERMAVEIETGKSHISANIKKLRATDFDRVLVLATSPSAVTQCQRALSSVERTTKPAFELWTWLDIS